MEVNIVSLSNGISIFTTTLGCKPNTNNEKCVSNLDTRMPVILEGKYCEIFQTWLPWNVLCYCFFLVLMLELMPHLATFHEVLISLFNCSEGNNKHSKIMATTDKPFLQKLYKCFNQHL